MTQLPIPEPGEMELTWQEIMSITELQVSQVGGNEVVGGGKAAKQRVGLGCVWRWGVGVGDGAGASRAQGLEMEMFWALSKEGQESRRSGGKARALRGRGVDEQEIVVVGREDLIGDASSLGSHSARVSQPHLLPRLPFFPFLCSALFQACPSSSLISSPCPQQLGPFPQVAEL